MDIINDSSNVDKDDNTNSEKRKEKRQEKEEGRGVRATPQKD